MRQFLLGLLVGAALASSMFIGSTTSDDPSAEPRAELKPEDLWHGDDDMKWIPQ